MSPKSNPGTGKGEGTLQCHLFRELSFHLLLEAPEQEGPEHLVQAADNEDCLLLVQVHLARERNCHQEWNWMDPNIPKHQVLLLQEAPDPQVLAGSIKLPAQPNSIQSGMNLHECIPGEGRAGIVSPGKETVTQRRELSPQW